LNIKGILTASLVACAALSTSACIGKSVQAGNVGVKVKSLGSNTGVQPEPLATGWHFVGIGEHIEEYPVITRYYPFTREAGEGNKVNEEITFADNKGVPMTADVAVTLQVEPAAAPAIYKKYRLDFNDLLLTPIRNDIRSAISAETEKVGVEDLISGGRQGVIQRALATVQRKWAPQGVNVSQLEWIGTIRYPDMILDAIKTKARTDQQTLNAQAQIAKAEAEAKSKIAEAQGTAESIRIINQALAANPRYVELKAVEKWNGVMPQYTGGSAVPFINVGGK
jgi:regulator of protease activity HflC (stomatin/prohibitin superfamily)